MLKTNKGGIIVPFIENNNPLWMNIESLIGNVLMPSNKREERIFIYDLIDRIIKIESMVFRMIIKIEIFS